MGTFIQVEIDGERCVGPEKSGECIKICPVNIFEARDGKTAAKPENEDECILCYLCLDKCPTSAITLKKLYEEKSR